MPDVVDRRQNLAGKLRLAVPLEAMIQHQHAVALRRPRGLLQQGEAAQENASARQPTHCHIAAGRAKAW